MIKENIRMLCETVLKGYNYSKYLLLSLWGCKRISSENQIKFAIVIQGPVISWKQVLCIKMMSRYHKNAYIIVSTWEDTKKEYIHLISRYTDLILLNKIPERHMDNRNFQIISAKNGIKEAKKMGFQYVLKSRTDVVLEKNVFKLYGKTKQRFSNCELATEYGMKERLLILWPRIYYYYRISDFVMMGHVEDMEKYWDCQLETRLQPIPAGSLFSLSKQQAAPEEYLAIHFAEKIGYSLKYSLDDNLYFLSHFFWVVKQRKWGLVWLKNPLPQFFRFKIGVDLIQLKEKEWKKLYNGENIAFEPLDVYSLSPNSKVNAFKVHRTIV